jgi:alkanesulfonate monooxygenase SsuD/methylene tetrahydromethanopterin reductase-like flavin-dependent oxidoreductase (luciferase family)
MLDIGTFYIGHAELDQQGRQGLLVKDRAIPNEQILEALAGTVVLACAAEEAGFDTFWMAEHHFQREGFEIIPNIPLLALHLAHHTKRIRFGCAFNILPTWHPLRLVEDFALVDYLTNGRLIFGVGRGYHSREIETFGSPYEDQAANRDLFEEQVELIRTAFSQERFTHTGKHYTVPPAIDYRGEPLVDLSVVPRPHRQPVEIYQPVVSASPRGLEFMLRLGIKPFIQGGLGPRAQDSVDLFWQAQRASGLDVERGSNVQLALVVHLADTHKQALAEASPWFEEHYLKVLGPLQMAGLSEDQIAALPRPEQWDEMQMPTIREVADNRSWYLGPPEGLVDYLNEVQHRMPGLEGIVLYSPNGAPHRVELEQLRWLGEAVLAKLVHHHSAS